VLVRNRLVPTRSSKAKNGVDGKSGIKPLMLCTFGDLAEGAVMKNAACSPIKKVFWGASPRVGFEISLVV